VRPELTKRADYAIRAMIALARSGADEPVSARRIASEMDIPVRFLPQVMADLGRSGLVRSTPGRHGGHRLARDPVLIDLLEIIEAIEGDSRRRTCVLRGGPCNASGQCDVHAVFFAAQEVLLRTLASADLLTIARLDGRSPPGAA
jgi:Rrf2 family protein